MSPDENAVVAFTDGACSGNPGPGGWGAVILLPDGTVRELGGGESRTTNNRMELLAAAEVLEAVPGELPVEVRTDSIYLIQGMTKWLAGWKRRGWKRRDWNNPDGAEVLNRDLWERLDSLAGSRRGPGVRWVHVRGHQDLPGNCRADAIAVAFSGGRPQKLYTGSISSYPYDLGRTSTTAGYPVYLSLLDGSPQRHASWAECEARVKGRKGVRFKKVFSAEEESEILKAWGA